jgi:uncharacterized protein with NRDE domain
MCLAAFAINASSRWPLVLASNRDEFFDRPALPVSSWQTAAGHTVVSGRDVLAGGTWLGASPGGRVALLTNVREGAAPAPPRSRGELVVRWLESSHDSHDFVAAIDSACYGGFNLVMGDLARGQWHWWSNRPASKASAPSRLANGVYGLSNAALDTPWPKTVALKAAMTSALRQAKPDRLEEALFLALQNEERPPIDQLPHTGVSPELELALSSARVRIAGRNYGTRCASVLMMLPKSEDARGDASSPASKGWEIRFKEWTYPPLTAGDDSPRSAAVCKFDLASMAAG